MSRLLTLVIFIALNWSLGTGNGEFCSRSIVAREGQGVIESYNYPFDYHHNLTCAYTIHLPKQNGVRTICFKFKRFRLEDSSPFCGFDYLKIGSIKYCGRGTWQFGAHTTKAQSNVWAENFCWAVKSDRFTVTFESDNSFNSGGFYATFTVTQGAIEEKPMVKLPGHAPCEAYEYTCLNRKCVNANVTCDGTDDCGDGSDEIFAHARCGVQNVLGCDFGRGDGYCGFTHEQGQWFRTNKRMTPYGPPGDHTNTTVGYYLYTDLDQSPSYLLSPQIALPNANIHCLSFWYYVYGNPASAKISVFSAREQAYSRPVWSRESKETKSWIKGQVALSGARTIQVIFGAKLGNSFTGVAIDDISLLEGGCYGDDISCNFEAGLCGWKSVPKAAGLRSGLIWNTHSRLSSSTVGPVQDHSSVDGSGKYLFVNWASKLERKTALALSPSISSVSQKQRCVQFWYYLAGLDDSCCSLKLFKWRNGKSIGDLSWSSPQSGARNAWHQASLVISDSEPFQLLFQGSVKAGEIAVDQVLLYAGSCTDTVESRCLSHQYQCASANKSSSSQNQSTRVQCIDKRLICSGRAECADGSDEDWRAGCKKTTTTTTTTTPAPSTTTNRCIEGHFKCKNDARCVPYSWVCDSFDDCGDNSDEMAGCSKNRSVQVTPISGCNETHFQCSDEKFCVVKTQICDGEKDCEDGSDEDTKITGCTAVLAASSDFPVGAIIGVVFASLVLVLSTVFITLVCMRRRQKRRTPSEAPGVTRSRTEISTISYGDDSSLRTTSGLEVDLTNESIQSPFRVMPPPYSERAVRPPSEEEPPPPYEPVAKQHTRATSALRPLLGNHDSSSSTAASTENIYDEPHDVGESGSDQSRSTQRTSDGGGSTPERRAPTLPRRPPYMPVPPPGVHSPVNQAANHGRQGSAHSTGSASALLDEHHRSLNRRQRRNNRRDWTPPGRSERAPNSGRGSELSSAHQRSLSHPRRTSAFIDTPTVAENMQNSHLDLHLGSQRSAPRLGVRSLNYIHVEAAQEALRPPAATTSTANPRIPINYLHMSSQQHHPPNTLVPMATRTPHRDHLISDKLSPRATNNMAAPRGAAPTGSSSHVLQHMAPRGHHNTSPGVSMSSSYSSDSPAQSARSTSPFVIFDHNVMDTGRLQGSVI